MNLFLVLVFAISLAVGEANAAKCRLYHKVRPGDSLWKVADRYNMYIKDILRANPKLRNKKYLRVGQKICIPYKKRSVKKKTRKRSKEVRNTLEGHKESQRDEKQPHPSRTAHKGSSSQEGF